MKNERRVFLLRLGFESSRQSGEADAQLGELEGLLNDGWNIVQTIPLAATGGITAVMVTPGSPGEAVRFAEWAGLLVLERPNVA